jgi:hypothetical protein
MPFDNLFSAFVVRNSSEKDLRKLNFSKNSMVSFKGIWIYPEKLQKTKQV